MSSLSPEEYLKKNKYTIGDSDIGNSEVVELVDALVAVQKAREENLELAKFYKNVAKSYKADWEQWNDEKDNNMEKLSVRVRRETAKEIFKALENGAILHNEAKFDFLSYNITKQTFLSLRGQSDGEKE